MIISNLVIPLIIILLAIVILTIALLQIFQAKKCNTITNAIVVSMDSKKVLKYKYFFLYKKVETIYYPTFKYKINGIEYTKKSFIGTSERCLNNSIIKIAYDKKNPKYAMLYENIVKTLTNGLIVSIFCIIFLIYYLIGFFTNLSKI